MTFVYPLLLGGLLLAALPVLLHFIVRRQPKTILFPAFRFLMQKQRSNTRNLRLRHLLLLLLRITLVVLVCLALARVRLFHEAFGINREKPVALVLVFDTSPSMEYKIGDVTRLDFAKKGSLDLLDQLPKDGRVLILDASDPASFATEQWIKTPEKARQRIRSLTIQPHTAPVTKALDHGLYRFDEWDRVGDDPEAAQFPRFVCVFSDRTKGSWESSTLAKRQRETPIKLLYFDVGIDFPVDLAITKAELPANRNSFAAGETIPLRVGVKATGKDLKNTVEVKIDGKDGPTQPIDLKAGQEQSLTLDIDTGNLEPGFHSIDVQFRTEDNALSFNDRRHVTFHINKKQPVLVLADDLPRTLDFANRLTDLLYAVDHKSVKDAGELTKYEAVFLVGVVAPSKAMWVNLEKYVEAGGGLAIIPPGLDKPDDDFLRGYNEGAAKKVMPAEIAKKMTPLRRDGGAWDFSKMEMRHPFLSLYAKWFAEDANFALLPAAVHYWKVNPVVDAESVAIYQDGLPAVVLRKAAGKVLLLTTPLDDVRGTKWNNYNETTTEFGLALTLMCAKYLCREQEDLKLNFQFGAEPPSVAKAPSLTFPKYVLSGGTRPEEIVFDKKNLWSAGRLTKAGHYTLSGANRDNEDQQAIHRFSINVPAEESDLTRLPSADIEAVMGKDSLKPLDRQTSLGDTLQWDEPIELFPWLMIGLLFLLALENLLANMFYKQEPAPAHD